MHDDMKLPPGEMQLRLATSRLMFRRVGLRQLWQNLLVSWQASRFMRTVIMPSDPDVVLRRTAERDRRAERA